MFCLKDFHRDWVGALCLFIASLTTALADPGPLAQAPILTSAASAPNILIVVDDSIVRGNTQRALVRMLREAGAREVHVRISSPPVAWPCFYGIDFASRAELIANGLSVEEICVAINADSLAFVTLDALVGATQQKKEHLCRACFDGVYPVDLPAEDRIGKSVLEGIARRVENSSGAGANDALKRV
jgi:amidophosphoribosyltransferase